jgi:CDP-diglyceride synthetase
MNNFVQRTITGVLFVAVIVTVIFSGSSALGFLFVGLSIAGFLEYSSILNKGGLVAPARLRGAVVTVLIHMAFWQAFTLGRTGFLFVVVPILALTAVVDLFALPFGQADGVFAGQSIIFVQACS